MKKQTKHDKLPELIQTLKLNYIEENLAPLTKEAGEKQWSHQDYLHELLNGEVYRRLDNKIRRRIKSARFPVLKTVEAFDFSWPRKINPQAVKDLFTLRFLEDHSNVILMGSVGLGKTHLACALAHQACLSDHSVLYTTAVDIINQLTAAVAAHRLKQELAKYLKPRILVMDEIGYLPIDKVGADLLFQVISGRYERTSTIFTTNKSYKKWSEIFNNDATLTSAILDRVLHHSHTITIEGKSYRMRDKINES